MKNTIYIFLLFVVTSCVKYGEPKSLSLSGEYVIDKIVYDNRNDDNLDRVFYPGDSYVNPSETKPLDTISVGLTRLALDYSVIYFDPVDLPSGSTTWNKMFTYYVQGHNNLYDLGYIVFDYDGTRRVWKIIDDGVDSYSILWQCDARV